MLIQGLAGLTGADVAVSNDPTGPAELGGDWVLETATGQVGASLVNAETIVGIHGLLAAGDLDTTFGSAGKVVTPVGPYDDYAHGVAIQSDGKIVVVGYTNDDWALARYNTNGSLDTSFGGTGKIITSIVGSGEHANSVAIQSNGCIVVAGAAGDFAVVRYYSDGTLDESFSGDGIVTTSTSSSSETVNSVAIQPDGKIVVAGNSGSHIALVRYNSIGGLDTSFSGDGIATMSFGITDRAWGMALQPDGKIVAVGDCWNGVQWDFLVVRFNADGTLDTSFSDDGRLTTAVGTSHDNGRGVAIQNGKIVVAGYSYSTEGAGNADFAVVRYNTDGALDTTFSGDGKQTMPVGPSDDWAYGVALQPDGKIVVAGASADTGYNFDFSIVRYNPDGTLDMSFSGDGKLTTAMSTAEDYINSVAIQPDGKVVVAGYSYSEVSHEDFAVARYEGDPVVIPPAITVQGNGVSIANGDMTPSSTDGTDFGSVFVSTSPISRTFTVRNDGTATLTLGAVTVPTSYTLTETLSSSLAPGASDTFTVRLDTGTAGTKSGDVSFTTGGLTEYPFNFRITGVVLLWPDIQVRGNWISISDGDTTPSASDFTDFGTVIQGTSGVTRVFLLDNLGGSTLTLGPVSVPTGYTLTQGPPASLGPGGTDSFVVRLDTTIVGTKTGDISIATNDPDENPFNFRITGTVQGPAPEVTVLGNGISIADGDTTPYLMDHTEYVPLLVGDTPVSHIFTVRNDGSLDLTLGSVSVPTGFTLAEGLSTSLAPGASDTFTVRLDTVTAGVKTGDVSFATNDPDENPFNFRITGTISAPGLPEVAVSHEGVAITDGDTTPATVDGTDFGTVLAGAFPISHTFVVANVGDSNSVLTAGHVTVPAGFTLVQDLSSTVRYLDPAVFVVRLDTSTPGTFSGEVSFSNSDSDENPFHFTITGTVTSSGRIVVDDMESYNDTDHRIFDTWIDGWINGTGSLVGYLVGPFAERTIVHGGLQSMPLQYDNTETPFYSEAYRTFTTAQDWTTGGAGVLSLWVRGQSSNTANSLYVAVQDTAGHMAVVTHPSTTLVQTATWTEWTMPLSSFSGVNMTQAHRMYLGIGNRSSPSADGGGRIFVDDITLVQVGPEIAVLGNDISITVGDVTPSAADGTDFGSVAQGDPAVSRTFTVRNDGGSILMLGPVSVPAGFTVTEGLATTLVPGESDTFTVRLDTAVAGPKTGDVSFSTNDFDENPFNFRITGTVVGVANLALGRPAVASTTQSGYPASNATDGNPSSRWASQYSNNEWLYVDLGSVYPINRVVLRWEAAYGRGYKLQVSSNASTWSDMYSTTTGDGGVDDITLAAPASGRYVRMLGTQRATMYGYSLWEFEVYGGGAGAPEAVVLGNGVSISDGDTSPGTADGTDFGSVAHGGAAVSRVFMVRNNGSSTLTLGAVAVPAGFTLTEGLSNSLAAGASDTFTVQLENAAPGTYSGEISFATNDSDENPFHFAITGTVGSSAVPEVTVTIAPSAVVEDGPTSLVYTFTRSVADNNPLTVSFSVGGTATFEADYTPTGAAGFDATSGTVVLGANQTTATVTVDPAVDTWWRRMRR